MKILLAIDQMCHGGAARVTAVLCNEFVRRGYDVIIATDLHRNEEMYPIDSNVRLFSIYSTNHSRHNFLTKIFTHVKLLRKLILKEKPDILIGIQENGALYAALARLFLRLPLISHRHNSFVIQGIPLYKRLIFNMADRTILLHNTDVKYVGNKISNTLAIYNPSTFQIKTIPQQDKEKIVVLVGSLDRWYNKGFDRAINIWSKVVHTNPEWKMYILGGGTDVNMKYLKELCETEGVSNSVYFTGVVSNVQDYLAKSSIFMLTSRLEGFPMVLNEAISQNCACISYRLSGVIDELYTDDAVLKVEDGNIDDMANLLSALIADSDKRETMAKHSQIEIKKYMPDVIVDKWDHLFAELTGQPMYIND